MSEEWLTPQDLADELGVPVTTVYGWNYTRKGPTYVKVGKHVRYRRRDVDEWLRANQVDRRAS